MARGAPWGASFVDVQVLERAGSELTGPGMGTWTQRQCEPQQQGRHAVQRPVAKAQVGGRTVGGTYLGAQHPCFELRDLAYDAVLTCTKPLVLSYHLFYPLEM